MRALIFAAGLLASVSVPSLAAGEGRPDLQLDDLHGRRRDLAAERGRIVVLNFWATWCLPCREEMPLLSAVHERYEDDALVVIGVSTDAANELDKVTRFVADHRLAFDIWVGGSTEQMRRFGLGEALPATAILDRDGSVAMRILGPVEPGDLESRIDWLLGPRLATAPESPLDRFSVGADGGGDAHLGPDADASGSEQNEQARLEQDEHEHGEHEHGEHEHGEHAPHRHGEIDDDEASLVPS